MSKPIIKYKIDKKPIHKRRVIFVNRTQNYDFIQDNKIYYAIDFFRKSNGLMRKPDYQIIATITKGEKEFDHHLVVPKSMIEDFIYEHRKEIMRMQ